MRRLNQKFYYLVLCLTLLGFGFTFRAEKENFKEDIIIKRSLASINVSANKPLVDVFNPDILLQIDRPGIFSLATVLGAKENEKEFLNVISSDENIRGLKILRLDKFYKENKLFQSVASTIDSDLSDIKKNIDVPLAYSSSHAERIASAGNVGRHFDTNWLTSKYAAFPLIAIINRIDKKDFSNSGCGELRFIYRLSYYKSTIKRKRLSENYSTLPVFLNVVYEYGTSDCESVAKDWVPGQKFSSENDYANWLQENPLNKNKHDIRFKQLELNMQAVRFPSGLKTHFGGQAIYLFRIFKEKEGSLKPVLLENTPNVSRIIKNPQLKNELLEILTDNKNIKKIDQGTFVLDEKFLTDRALSFSTTGRSRMANRPFSSIFMGRPYNGNEDVEESWEHFVNESDRELLKSVDLSETEFIKGPIGIIERMNNRSCVGCHQSNGTAGFHTLGMPSKLNSSFNQVVLPFSPHYYAERIRRENYLNQIIAGKKVNKFRPHSSFPEGKWGSSKTMPEFEKSNIRDICLPKSNGHLVGGGCKDRHAECRVNVSNERVGVQFGECIIKPSQAKEYLFAGNVCRQGKITNYKSYVKKNVLKLKEDIPYNLKNYQDIIKDLKRSGIPEKIYSNSVACGKPIGGVPLGRVSKRCSAQSKEGRLEFMDKINGEEDLEKVPRDYCSMRGGIHFDLCAASDDPINCLSNTKVRRSKLDACYLGQFCREDYICQQLPVGIARDYKGRIKESVTKRVKKMQKMGIGFCTPNYFVFNMRVDGHILPEKTKSAERILKDGFVYLKDIDPTIQQEISYGTNQNFTEKIVPGYLARECILKKEAAKALSRVQKSLKEKSNNLSLKIFDCYRPQRSVKAFVKWANDGKDTLISKKYYPRIKNKKDLIKLDYISAHSSHSKGVTIDLTIVDLDLPTSKIVDDLTGYGDCRQSNRIPDAGIDMGSGFDCFDSISHTNNQNISKQAGANRKQLLNLMKEEGFANYSKEWWHFSYKGISAGKIYYDFLIR